VVRCILEILCWCASIGARSEIPPKLSLTALGRGPILGSRYAIIAMHGPLLRAETVTVKPACVVRDLGVFLEEELKMRQHTSNVASVGFYHVRRLKLVRSIPMGRDHKRQSRSDIVLSRLDYSNTVLAIGPHDCTTTANSKCDHTTHQSTQASKLRKISTT